MDIQQTTGYILEQQAHFSSQIERFAEQQLQSEERRDREIADIRAEPRCAVRLSIEGARREQERRLEMFARLSAAQQVTEEKQQRLIDSLEQPRKRLLAAYTAAGCRFSL